MEEPEEVTEEDAKEETEEVWIGRRRPLIFTFFENCTMDAVFPAIPTTPIITRQTPFTRTEHVEDFPFESTNFVS